MAKTQKRSGVGDAEYRGVYFSEQTTVKQRKKNWTHRIVLFEPEKSDAETIDLINNRLIHIYNVHEHSMEDFEFNSWRIIRHYEKYYGDTSMGIFTIGQSIRFRVRDGGPEFELPLFQFFINYTMLILLVEVGCDLTDWQPWTPHQWSADGWVRRMNQYIKMARPLANIRKIGECLQLTKHLIAQWCVVSGTRIGLSISNWEFIQLMKRDEEIRKSLTCSFDIPEGIAPQKLEKLTMDRTIKLLDFIGNQTDLSISVYAKNKLFNPTQFREFAVHITFKPTLDGVTIPYTYPTNVIMGINDIRAFNVDAHGGRKAEITKLNVSDAGALERSLMMMMSPLRFVDINYECNSRHFRKRYISGRSDLEKLDGRVYTTDPNSNEFTILDPDESMDLIGDTIYLKTPITCTHPRRREGYICSACYGKLMSNLNRDTHIGRLAATQSADEIEQKLLSAKHALRTDTANVSFDDDFYQYFDLGNGVISLSQEIIEASAEGDRSIDHLYLEFYPATMKKNQDGESRRLDRSFREIIVFNSLDGSRTTIAEKNGAMLYISPEFNDNHFLPALRYAEEGEVIQIPFSDIVDTGTVQTEVLFEFTYQNNEIASPLLKLEKIMFNCNTIAAFDSYDDCLDQLMPLFVRGGIDIPDYQTEMLVTMLVRDRKGGYVDWNEPDPDYTFVSIDKSIFSNSAPLTSVLYQASGAQIAGAYGTYDKSDPDCYAYFMRE